MEPSDQKALLWSPSRSRIAAVTAAVSAMMLSMSIAFPARPAMAATTAWTVSKSYAPPFDHVDAVACATTSVCEAFATLSPPQSVYNGQTTSVVLGTTNGGHTWKAQKLPSGITLLDSVAVACASGTRCEAVGTYGVTQTPFIFGTTNGGATWVSQRIPTVTTLSGIACASATTCEAIGVALSNYGTILGTTNGGATWGPQNFPQNAVVQGIACATVTTCEAVGALSGQGEAAFGSTNANAANGGATWRAQKVPGNYALASVACPTTVDCEAVGEQQVASNPPSVVSIVIGTVNANAANGGATWKTQSERGGGLTAIACPSASLCEAVGVSGDYRSGVVVGTEDSGRTWKAQKIPTDFTDWLYGVACAHGSTACEAVGYGKAGATVLRTTDAGALKGGAVWNLGSLGTGPSVLDGVTCGTSSACQVVGAAGPHDGTGASAVLSSANADAAVASWHTTMFPTRAAVFSGASCASSTICETVGYTALSLPIVMGTTDGGATWTAQTVPAGVYGLTAIACASVSTCEAVGVDVYQLSVILGTTNADAAHGKAIWKLQSVPVGVPRFISAGITCATPSTCEAVGTANPAGAWILGTTNANATNDGAIWDTQALPAGVSSSASDLFGVACPTARSCEAVGGITYSSAPSPVIFGTTNASAAGGGATWKVRTLPTAISGLYGSFNAVACATASTCEAVGQSAAGYPGGFVAGTTSAGVTWKAQKLPPAVVSLTGVACAKASGTCQAVGQNVRGGGMILTYKRRP